MPVRVRYLVVGVAELALVAALAHYAHVMAPVKDASPRAFWLKACGVVCDGRLFRGGTYGPRNGWFIYYEQGFHGQFLYRVSRDEALAVLPDVLPQLDAAADAGQMGLGVTEAYRAWSRAGGVSRNEPEALLDGVREARIAYWEKEDKGAHGLLLAEEREFDARWRSVDRYWANILFEFAYLTGLLLFVAWPWLRVKALWRWTLHFGLLPLLLFLPYFLGYALFTFTSAGPSGGALYPWLIIEFWPLSFWTQLDTAVFEATPRLLEPISQPLGPMVSLTSGGFGRVAVGVGCILMAATTLAAGAIFRAGRKWLVARSPAPGADAG